MRHRTSRVWWPNIGLFVVLCATSVGRAQAEVKLDLLFTKDAVLQQGMPCPVFGTGTPGEELLVTIQDQRKSAVVDADGRWRVVFDPLTPGGPYLLNLTGKRISTQYVMVGEVWVLAGGSNMQWEVMNATGFGNAIGWAGNRDLRLFSVRREGAAEPRYSTDSIWHTGGAASIGVFSAVGYWFGRDLQPHLKDSEGNSGKVPIGLINCNHYDSTIESWISREAIEEDKELKTVLNQPIDRRSRAPSSLFNSMVNPLTQFAVRGVIWYHGEGEANRAYEYRHALGVMIADWRKHWDRPDLPFVVVQHAPFRPISKFIKDTQLAVLRDSQWYVSRQVPNVALVVTTDYGNQFNPNPPEKEPIGKRAALAARALAYKEKIVHQGPTYVATQFGGGQAVVRFENIGGGLEFKGEELQGFIIAGPDHIFREAKAEIKDGTVVVSSPEVPAPEAVRYGWADFPTGNLFNKEGLPASPFRTDNYPIR